MNSTLKTLYSKSMKTQSNEFDSQKAFRDQQIDKGLIILDNADVFEKNNGLELEMNLNVMKKNYPFLTFIF